MNPLVVYVSFAALLIAFSIGVRIYKQTAVRKCHLCGSMVELGRQRCPVCDYRFIN